MLTGEIWTALRRERTGGNRHWDAPFTTDIATRRLNFKPNQTGRKFRPTTVVGERCDGRQHVLIAALASKARLHSPDRDERPRRNAVVLLDRCGQRGLGLLQRAPAGDDGGSPAFREKLVERQTEAPLAAVVAAA
jgi:hypothetical protein